MRLGGKPLEKKNLNWHTRNMKIYIYIQYTIYTYVWILKHICIYKYIYIWQTPKKCAGKKLLTSAIHVPFFLRFLHWRCFRWRLQVTTCVANFLGIFKRHRDAFPARKPVEEKVVYQCLSMFIPLFTRFWLHPGWLALGFLNHQEYLTRLQDPTQDGDTMSWDPSTCLRACRFVALRSKPNFCKAT